MGIPTNLLVGHSNGLSEKLEKLHNQLLENFSHIDRIACALYDSNSDKLKTFINSTRAGVALKGYEFKLSESYSLLQLATKRESRVLNDIPNEITSESIHARWVEDQGYLSSFTVPLYNNEDLLGIVFFDSQQRAAFTPEVQRNLELYCSLIAMSILNELSVVRVLLESVRMARDLSEVRDFETGTHLERIARYSRIIAKAIATKHEMSDEFIECIYLFAPLHDVGKIGIPDHILLKAGKLTDAEMRIMQTHVEKGLKIVDKISEQVGENGLTNSTILHNIVGYHHEYLDGSGYPNKLKGDAIPIEARIITVADIYDALTTPRSYKNPWTQDDALTELRNMQVSGKLDIDCVDALFSNKNELIEIQKNYFDS